MNFNYICAIVLSKLVNTYDYLSRFIQTTLQGIQDAHSESTWIFSSPNTYPLPVKDSWKGIDLSSSRVYYPATHKFSKLSDSKSYADIITVSLSGENFTHDLSAFLYLVNWPADMEVPPSIYELVLLSLMAEKIYVPYEELDTYSLDIMKYDGYELTIRLSSEFVKKPFRGWDTDDLKID
jgi:hypothetical protein